MHTCYNVRVNRIHLNITEPDLHLNASYPKSIGTNPSQLSGAPALCILLYAVRMKGPSDSFVPQALPTIECCKLHHMKRFVTLLYLYWE